MDGLAVTMVIVSSFLFFRLPEIKLNLLNCFLSISGVFFFNKILHQIYPTCISV